MLRDFHAYSQAREYASQYSAEMIVFYSIVIEIIELFKLKRYS